MLFSTSLLKNAMQSKKPDPNSDLDYDKISPFFKGYFIFIYSVLFIIEVIVLYYSVVIAVKTTKKGPERTVNLILACLFSFPYMMLNLLLNPEARKVLGSSRS